ncbi:hypothetical protein Glove_395g79 [Diversispora epigaea]|uniref:Uncharacterized protein n=1 Tax=Diversispora epigaea TaxID=1348612 RepID=A0A397H1H7_9GLOM|nr:hypothetical protein Glove_395g79 [Diversispora epigaea]
MNNLNELFKKKKQNPSCTSLYSCASSSHPSSALVSHSSSVSASRCYHTVTRRIFLKLDILKTLLEKVKKNQEDIKEEIKAIKEEVAIFSYDQACINIVIIKSAQDLLEKKIYFNYDKFKKSAEFFLGESDNEFFFTLDKIFLNLKNEVIKMLEEIIQPTLAKNLRKIENEKGFKYESDSSPTFQKPVSPERQKDPEKQIEPERNKGKKRIENNEYEENDEYEEDDEDEEVNEGEEGDEGEEGEDDDNKDEEGEDEEYHNEIVNIESKD